MQRWDHPEGLRVLPDGTWQVGELPVVHTESLRWLKAHLVFGELGTFVVDREQRLPVLVSGPPFEVLSLEIDGKRSVARAVLDDGSHETLQNNSLEMNEDTGRFECLVRGGLARALLSRSAHQQLLENAEQTGAGFGLRAGSRLLTIRT